MRPPKVQARLSLCYGILAPLSWRNLPKARRQYNACFQDALNLFLRCPA